MSLFYSCGIEKLNEQYIMYHENDVPEFMSLLTYFDFNHGEYIYFFPVPSLTKFIYSVNKDLLYIMYYMRLYFSV